MTSEFKNFSKKYISLIDSNISEYYESKSSSVKSEWLSEIYNDILEYCKRPGKRIRPLLLIAGFEGYSGNNADSDIIKIASTLEIMHSFLLIHDDIIDKANTRRGKEALHILQKKRYEKNTKINSVGQDVAIITGDMMAFNCLEILSECAIEPSLLIKFLKIYSETYEYTAWGQILDIISSRPYKMIEGDDIPLEISMYKTSYYTIANPLVMGAVLSDKTTEEEIANIKNFALPLGLAFQIRDDILGVFGIDSDTGKSSITDILEEKNTLLIQRTLCKLNEDDKKIFLELFTSSDKNENAIQKIKAMIKESGALQSCLDELQNLTNESIEKLQFINIRSEYKEILLDVVKIISKVNIE